MTNAPPRGVSAVPGVPGVPWIVLAIVAALGAGALLVVRPWEESNPGDDATRRAAPPASSETDRAFSLDSIPRTVATGDPIVVRRSLAAGDAFRSRGRIHYLQAAAGTFGRMAAIPRRSVDGAVEAVRRVEAAAGGRLASVVVVDLELADATGAEAPRARRERVEVRFEEDPAGGARNGTLKVEGAPEDLAAILEALVSTWADRPPLPDRAVKVGENFELEEVVDLDPMLRQLMVVFHQAGRDPRAGAAHAPVLGRIWVESRERVGDDDVLAVRVALRQQKVSDLGSPGPGVVTLGYAAAWNDVRRVAVEGGTVRSCALDRRQRIRARSHDLDYAVDVASTVDLETVRER